MELWASAHWAIPSTPFGPFVARLESGPGSYGALAFLCLGNLRFGTIRTEEGKQRERCSMTVSPPRERSKPKTTERAGARATLSEGRSREEVYARFLGLPPALVLAVLWLLGAALLASCGLALYLVVTAIA